MTKKVAISDTCQPTLTQSSKNTKNWISYNFHIKTSLDFFNCLKIQKLLSAPGLQFALLNQLIVKLSSRHFRLCLGHCKVRGKGGAEYAQISASTAPAAKFQSGQQVLPQKKAGSWFTEWKSELNMKWMNEWVNTSVSEWVRESVSEWINKNPPLKERGLSGNQERTIWIHLMTVLTPSYISLTVFKSKAPTGISD